MLYCCTQKQNSKIGNLPCVRRKTGLTSHYFNFDTCSVLLNICMYFFCLIRPNKLSTSSFYINFTNFSIWEWYCFILVSYLFFHLKEIAWKEKGYYFLKMNHFVAVNVKFTLWVFIKKERNLRMKYLYEFSDF